MSTGKIPRSWDEFDRGDIFNILCGILNEFGNMYHDLIEEYCEELSDQEELEEELGDLVDSRALFIFGFFEDLEHNTELLKPLPPITPEE